MKPLLLTYALLCGADSATTYIALAHGGREVWLPTQNPYVIHATTAAQYAVFAWSLQDLNKQHPKLARVVGWSVAAVRGVAVAYNVRQVLR